MENSHRHESKKRFKRSTARICTYSIKDPEGHDIYSEVVNGLRVRGYITNILETRQQIRQRQ